MAGVTVPNTSKKSELGQVGGVVGGIAGAYYGKSPQAAAGGYAAGSQLGQAVDPDKESSTPQVGSGSSAMQRRSEALSQYQQPSQNEQQLAQAETAAQQLPPEQQRAYLPAIQAARARAASTGGTV